MIRSKISDVMKYPNIIKMDDNLYAIVFDLLKIVPAKYAIEKALADGRIKPETVVVETSSGTYALGMGIVCAENRLKFRIFSDSAIDETLKRRLEELGGVVDIVTAGVGGNPQGKRLEALGEFLESNEAYWTRQYDNAENREAYHEIAAYVLESLGQKDINLVGPVGSGGSTSGMIEGMRKVNPATELVGVDTFSSVLFGQNDGKRLLRGLGNSIKPGNLIHEYYDEIHWLDAEIVHEYTRRLHAKHAIFAGPTSGASYLVARHLAEQNPDKCYAFIAPDSGHRYTKSVYEMGDAMPHCPVTESHDATPIEVNHPMEGEPPWTFMKWGRKSLAEYHTQGES